MSLPSNSTMPSAGYVDNLMKTAYVIQIFGGHDNLKMLDLVNLLLENTTAARTHLGPLTKPADPIYVLEELHWLIPRLPHDMLKAWVAFYLVWFVIAMVVVALRLYTRHFITKKLRPEDLFSIFSLFMVACNTATFTTVNFFSPHIWDCSLNDIKNWIKVLFAADVVFVLTHFSVRMVFLIFYAALSPKKSYKIAVYAVGLYVCAFTVAYEFTMIFQCSPVDYWNHLSTTKCTNRTSTMLAFGIMYITSDFMILLLPISTIWSLQLRLKEKLVLCTLFGMGGFVCFAGIKRLIVIDEWLSAGDFTYKVCPHGPWGVIELDMLLIISCLPALKALFFPTLGFAPAPGRAGPVADASWGSSSGGSSTLKRARSAEEKLRSRGLNIFGGVTRSFRLKSKLGTTVMEDSVLRENVLEMGLRPGGGSSQEIKDASLANDRNDAKDQEILEVKEEKIT